MWRIPLAQLPAQTFNIVLADQHCTLSLYWRQAALYLDLVAGGAPVCTGALCRNRTDIVQSRSRNFSGTLYFLDREGDRPPHWEGLHTGSAGRWMLLYLEDGEEIPETLRY
jgi:hypothetical protein